MPCNMFSFPPMESFESSKICHTTIVSIYNDAEDRKNGCLILKKLENFIQRTDLAYLWTEPEHRSGWEDTRLGIQHVLLKENISFFRPLFLQDIHTALFYDVSAYRSYVRCIIIIQSHYRFLIEVLRFLIDLST